jgi:Domain of unknown function (DUF4136)
VKRLIGLASAFVLVASLAPAQDVGYNFDQQADFAKYKTYKWVAVKGAEQPNELVAKQIMDSIDRQLATKGLTRTDSDTADLYVAYQVAVDQEKQMTTFDTGYAMGPGWGGRYHGGYYGGGTSTSTTSTIHVGTVALDMYDRASKQLVWRGMASKQLDPKAKPEKRQKNLDKAMQKLLKNYPPKKD